MGKREILLFMMPLLTQISPSASFSADPSPESVVETLIDDVSGGWATAVPPHKLSLEFSPSMRNVFIDNDSIEQIPGFAAVGSTNTLASGQGIFPFIQEDGTTLFLVTDSSVVLETQDYKSYVFVSSGHNTGVLMRCRQIENKMWCSNGVDSVFTWDHVVKTILDGTKGTPNVPKGKYIEHYQERVWMFNTPSDASAVYFSDVRSTAGAIIAPDNFLAWPADNVRWVGKGDGQTGTAIWKENGFLKFGKDRSIYALYGTNASNYLPRLSNPNVGVASHDSVAMIDNESRFVGHDGIYRGEIRKSDLISDESDSIFRSAVRTVSNLWESQTDFARGQFDSFGTTTTDDGLVTIYAKDLHMNWGKAETIFASSPTNFFEFTSTATQNTDYGVRLPTASVDINFLGFYASEVKLVYRCFPSGDVDIQVKILNARTGDSASLNQTITCASDPGFQFKTFTFGASPVVPFIGSDISGNNFRMQVTTRTNMTAGKLFHFYLTTCTTCADVGDLIHSTTGQFISDIASNTSITAWGTFDSVRNPGGGAINYYRRTSTSLVNITTQAWSPVVPGVTLSDPLQNRFVQWAATIASISNTNVSNIDNVEIVHVEGEGAINRAFAVPWKGRYWMFASTSADTVSSFGLISAIGTNKNPDAWMPVSGINVRSIAKSGEQTLYAGSSSSGSASIAVFYRLDFGDNFNGKAISSFYETPDWSGDSIYKEKSLFEYYLVAGENPGSAFNLGLSKDGGSFTDTSYSLSGTGVLNRSISNVIGKAKYFRWRFSHSVYDEGFKIHNFAVRYMPTGLRKGIND